jgi:hypothetical protein
MNRSRAGENTALFFFALAIGPILGAGCADPKGAFESYVDRTNGVRGVVPDTGVSLEDTAPATDSAVDTPPFDANVDVTGNYFVSCLPTLLGGEASQSLLFYAEVTSAGGKLSFNSYPLSETATKFSKTETVGVPQVASMVPIAASGSWNVTLGTVKIPGNSQRIGDSDLVLENLSYKGHIVSADRLCAELDGQLVSPFAASFDEPGDICIFVRMAPDVDLPTAMSGSTTYVGYPAAEHHCP